MKKTTLFTLLLVFHFGLKAQQTIEYSELKTTAQAHSSSNNRSTSVTTSSIGTLLFEETFGNGLTGDGTNGTWTTYGSPSTALWEYRGTSTVPDISVGSRGAFATNTPAINSATHTNGFFIFDSDYLDNGGDVDSLGFGNAPSPHAGYLESPSIDLSSYPHISIELSSYYRTFNSKCVIEFSIDGGATWTDSIVLYARQNALNIVSDATSTNDVTSSEIPSGIGGNANVKFRLYFDGSNVTGNPNGSGYYFWQVDDIAIRKLPDYDLKANNNYFNSISDVNSKRYNYALIPQRQSINSSLDLGLKFENNGSETQHNVKAHAKINSPNNSILLSSTSTVTALTPNNIDSLNIGLFTQMDSVGVYNILFYSNSDSSESIPDNDTIKWQFEVSDNVYAWSNTPTSDYRPTNATTSYEICSYFEIKAMDTATAMRVQFYNNPNDPIDPVNLKLNDSLSFRILRADLFDNNSEYTGPTIAKYINGNSSIYSIQSSDIGNEITVPLTHNIHTPNLSQGGYFVCVKSYQHEAYLSCDGDKSIANWRPGTTIFDLDGNNSWNNFNVTPTIQLITKGGTLNPPCDTTSITGEISTLDTNSIYGSFEVMPLGGVAPYTVQWIFPDGSDSVGNFSLGGLDQRGLYAAIVTDANGCQSGSILAELGNCIGLDSLNININSSDVSSSGANDGTITANISGGSDQVNITWTGPNGFNSTDTTITGLETGAYTLSVSDPQCPQLNKTKTIYIYVTSINEINSIQNVKVFPNPNNGRFTLEVENNTETSSLIIKNVMGQSIHEMNITKGQRQYFIDLKNPSSGVYFIELIDNKGEKNTVKMIVQ